MEAFLQSGAVSAVLQVTLDKFLKFASRKIATLLSVDKDLKKLERTMLKVQAVVDNVKSNQHWSHNKNKAPLIWLRDLQNVLYDADDFLDWLDFSAESTDPHKVRNLVLTEFKFNIPCRLHEILEKLEAISREMDGFFMNEAIQLTQPNFMVKVQKTSLVNESHVIGRDNDKAKIITKLLSQGPDGENVSVIAIVGMPGVGKTTLAQLTYNHENVIRKFDFRIWVSVSVGYTVERITKSILESISRKMVKLLDLDPIQMELQKVIAGQRILVVLDNMWSEKASDWDTLYLPFKAAAPGSKILVTTRSMTVSRIVATSRDAIYRVPLLTKEDCWELIKQRTLLVENRDDHRGLAKIGEKIAEKCGGLPLAAKVLASIMRFRFDEMEWNAILNCKLWDLPESENEILPALKSSYYYLPPYLKRCFAYCSIFDQNFEFKKDDLVKLWVAEGFIRPKELRRPEDIGKEYFEILVSWSLFEETDVDPMDNQSKYKMHDLIHDLTQYVSEETCLRMKGNMSVPLSNVKDARHSSMLCEDIQSEVFENCVCLRTFIVFCERRRCQINEISYSFLGKFHHIRVLNLSCANIIELPNVFGHLKQLRHLDISNTQIQELPKSITNVYGLQTLKLRNCKRFLHFPKEMKNLTNLRHLDFDTNGVHSIAMPPELGKLTNLQTLPIFIVGRENGQRIEELKDLGCLHGSICITNLENVASRGEASTAKLVEKPYLNKLELHWERGSDANQQVLECLRPHDTIQQLIIRGYGGFFFPNWLIDPSFYRLESIYLKDCSSYTAPHSLGKLPLLKTLHLEQMPNLAFVDGSGDFPSLKTLKIENMGRLKEWNGLEPGDMPKLGELIIRCCERLNFLLPVHYFTSLENLEIEGCPQLQSLPAEGLPKSLKFLTIFNCNTLSQRCLVSQEWNGIPSICCIVIEEQIIWNNDSQV